MVQDLVDFKGHGLAGPHGRYFTKPAICVTPIASVSWLPRRGEKAVGFGGRRDDTRICLPLMVG